MSTIEARDAGDAAPDPPPKGQDPGFGIVAPPRIPSNREHARQMSLFAAMVYLRFIASDGTHARIKGPESLLGESSHEGYVNSISEKLFSLHKY